MAPLQFESIEFLPDPILGYDGHYKTFADIYGSVTTEKQRPLFRVEKVHRI